MNNSKLAFLKFECLNIDISINELSGFRFEIRKNDAKNTIPTEATVMSVFMSAGLEGFMLSIPSVLNNPSHPLIPSV